MISSSVTIVSAGSKRTVIVTAGRDEGAESNVVVSINIK